MQIIGLHGPARAGKDTIADYLVSQYDFLKFAFSDALYREVADAYALPDENLLRGEATKEVTTLRMSLDRCADPVFAELARSAILEAHQGLAFPRHIGLSPRWVLQQWGTEYRRAQDPNYWVKQGDLWMQAFVGTLKRTVTQEDRDAWIDQRRDMGSYDMLTREEIAEGAPPVGLEYVVDHPGVAVSGVRFQNEYDWLKRYNGVLWHVTRRGVPPIALTKHVSEEAFSLLTGDKLIQNNSTVERLHTGVVLALQGNDIVNTAEE
jgi:hypothetical protein